MYRKLRSNDGENVYVDENFKGSAHANSLIFNTIDKTIERFDPHGDVPTFYDYQDVDDALFNAFKHHLNKKIKGYQFHGPSYTCPNMQGFQANECDEESACKLDYEGYCTIWSIFYMDLRMSNKTLSKEELVKKATGKIFNIKFKQYIYNYLIFFSHISEQIKYIFQEYENHQDNSNVPAEKYIKNLENKLKTTIDNFANIYTTGVELERQPSWKNKFNSWITNVTNRFKIPMNQVDMSLLEPTYLDFYQEQQSKKKFLNLPALKELPDPEIVKRGRKRRRLNTQPRLQGGKKKRKSKRKSK